MDKKILAKVSIGHYDVEDGDSGRFYIEVDFNDGEEPVILTEEDPNAALEDPNDTLIDPWLSDCCYDVLLKSGLATEQAAAHCDPNDNGGFMARVFRIKEDGEFTIYDDYTYTEG
jgi:hypothetical protein